MHSVKFIGRVLGICFFISVIPAFATPTYQAVNSNNANYDHGLAVIDMPTVPNYGEVGIEYHCWQDLSTNLWYYSYKILNNGTPGTSEDYHFGWNSNNPVGTYMRPLKNYAFFTKH